MTGHLPPQVVSDLDAGLLEAGAAAAADAHLATCSDCAQTRAALHVVRARLAADDPGPLPVDVAARLDAALADEALTSRGGQQAHAALAPRPHARIPRLTSRRSSRRRPLGGRLIPAAALALVLGSGALAVTINRGAGLSTTGGSASAASAAPAASPGSAAAGGSATSPASPAAEDAGQPAAGGGAAQAAPAPPVTFSGRNYRPADLPGAARALVAAPKQSSAAAGQAPARVGGGTENDAARLAGQPALDSCLQGLRLPGPVLGVDVGAFRGSAALLVVAADAGDPGQLEVRVVAPGCSVSDPHQLAAVRVPRN